MLNISYYYSSLFTQYYNISNLFERNEERTTCKISVNGKILEQVNEVVYLGSMFYRDGRYEMNVKRRIATGSSKLH